MKDHIRDHLDLLMPVSTTTSHAQRRTRKSKFGITSDYKQVMNHASRVPDLPAIGFGRSSPGLPATFRRLSRSFRKSDPIRTPVSAGPTSSPFLLLSSQFPFLSLVRLSRPRPQKGQQIRQIALSRLRKLLELGSWRIRIVKKEAFLPEKDERC